MSCAGSTAPIRVPAALRVKCMLMMSQYVLRFVMLWLADTRSRFVLVAVNNTSTSNWEEVVLRPRFTFPVELPSAVSSTLARILAVSSPTVRKVHLDKSVDPERLTASRSGFSFWVLVPCQGVTTWNSCQGPRRGRTTGARTKTRTRYEVRATVKARLVLQIGRPCAMM